jgi:hypothetical protein
MEGKKRRKASPKKTGEPVTLKTPHPITPPRSLTALKSPLMPSVFGVSVVSGWFQDKPKAAGSGAFLLLRGNSTSSGNYTLKSWRKLRLGGFPQSSRVIGFFLFPTFSPRFPPDNALISQDFPGFFSAAIAGKC